MTEYSLFAGTVPFADDPLLYSVLLMGLVALILSVFYARRMVGYRLLWIVVLLLAAATLVTVTTRHLR